MHNALTYLVGLMLVAQLATAADWPQYRADAARSGYSADPIDPKLTLRWEYHACAPPQPAWRGDDTRMQFDYVYHAVVGHDLVYFGSSADCKVHALDKNTGRERWAFTTDSPVRFAPALWKEIGADGFGKDGEDALRIAGRLLEGKPL